LDNTEVRAKILRIFYDLEMNVPGSFLKTAELPDLMPGVPQNLLDANTIYLFHSRLIEGFTSIDKAAPPITRITPMGINVVENPNAYSSQFSLNIRQLHIGTNYGQVAQADRGAAVIQTQTYSSFNELRELVKTHSELSECSGP